MKNLAHSASFESLDKNAPSKAGTKQLVSTTVPPRIRVSVRTTLEETAKMLAQSGEDSLAVMGDDGRMAGVVDIRQIVKAMAPPEPTPVGNSAILNRHLIHNEDIFTATIS
jgi:CBS domain-containing protein